MYLCRILHYDIYIYICIYTGILSILFKLWGLPKFGVDYFGSSLDLPLHHVLNSRPVSWLRDGKSFEALNSRAASPKPCQEGGNNCNCLCTCAEFHSSATKRPPPQGGKFAVTHPFTWKITWICWRCDNLPGTNGLGYHTPNLNLFYKLDEGYKCTCYWPLTAKDSRQSSVASSWKLWIKSTSSTWLWHYGYSQVWIIVKISGSGWAVESATRSTT